ncbi:helix-turn-helix transcriptional regulator, partial [Bacillus velezensis]
VLFSKYIFRKEVRMKTAVENELELKKIEISVIKLIIAEKPNKEIAKSLNYSQRNVEYIIAGLCKKWNVSTRVGIVSEAYKRNCIQ